MLLTESKLLELLKRAAEEGVARFVCDHADQLGFQKIVLLDIPDVAKLLRIDRKTVMKYAADGLLIKRGYSEGRVYFWEHEVLRNMPVISPRKANGLRKKPKRGQ